jgi:hypothetical protein
MTAPIQLRKPALFDFVRCAPIAAVGANAVALQQIIAADVSQVSFPAMD